MPGYNGFPSYEDYERYIQSASIGSPGWGQAVGQFAKTQDKPDILPPVPGVDPNDGYAQYAARMKLYNDYALAHGASPQEAEAYSSRLAYTNFNNYGMGDPAAGWAKWQQERAAEAKLVADQNAGGVGWGAQGAVSGFPAAPAAAPPPQGGAVPPAGGGTPYAPPAPAGYAPPPPAGFPPVAGGGTPSSANPLNQSSWLGPYGGNAASTTDFYSTLPKSTRTFPGFPAGTENQALLPGFGQTQQLDQFGIAGLERNQLIGGGSWNGTVWNPVNGQATYTQNPVILPETEYYDQYGNPKPLTAGNISIRPSSPYVTSNFLQTYGGVQAPFGNIHQQIGAAMAGVPPAYPGFKWAAPEMALGQKGATGPPPGGWTQMLGYTPGAPSNYGFQGGRPNPYGLANLPLGAINPTIGG